MPARGVQTGVLIACAVLAAGCGGGSSDKAKSTGSTAKTETTTTSTTATTAAPGVPTQDQPVTSVVRTLDPKASKPPDFSDEAKAGAGDEVQAQIRILPKEAGKPLHVRLRSRSSTVWALESRLGTTGSTKSRIVVSPGLHLARLGFSCRVAGTFCPGRPFKRSSSDVSVTFPGNKVPATLSIIFDRAAKIAKPKEFKLAGKGAPLMGRLKVQANKPGQKKGRPADSVTVSPGSVVRAVLRPVPGSGSGTVKFSIPKATGSSISLKAVSRTGKGVGSATVKAAKGSITLAQPNWKCAVTPTSFCPFTKATKSGAGYTFELPMPKVPMAVRFKVQKG